MSDRPASTDECGELRQRVRLLVAYDGGSFSGFAKNQDIVSVAGVLEAALERILRHPVVVTGAGRTDKGVHAWGQVVSFDTYAERFDPRRLQRSLNGVCGPDITVREVTGCGADFDARFSARSRTYRYHLNNGATQSPFTARYSWHLAEPLSVDAMNDASVALIGEHDFSSFCRRPPSPPDRPGPLMTRTVQAARWTDVGDANLRFEITARAFCHQMVRSIVGTLADIGRGHRAVSEIGAILESRDRSTAGNLAPPHGLCLWEVRY